MHRFVKTATWCWFDSLQIPNTTTFNRNGKQDTFRGSKLIHKDSIRKGWIGKKKTQIQKRINHDDFLNVRGRFVEKKTYRNYYNIIALISSSFKRKKCLFRSKAEDFLGIYFLWDQSAEKGCYTLDGV